MIISVCGKGGTGKTTLAGLIVGYIRNKKLGSVLAVDGDPNATLCDILGVKNTQTIVGAVDEMSAHKDEMPAGMTKDRFVDLRIQEAIVEEDGFDLLVMGRPEGPGCYCYINSLLRDLIGKLMKSYDFVVIDNEAGMEHISRRTTKVANRILLVSDPTIIGIRSAGRIYELAKDVGIKFDKAFLAINRSAGRPDALSQEIERLGLPMAGTIPYSEELLNTSIGEGSVFELDPKFIEKLVGAVMNNLLMKQNIAQSVGG